MNSVGVQELFDSFCRVLGIDPRNEYHIIDARPVKLVEGGKRIEELFTGSIPHLAGQGMTRVMPSRRELGLLSRSRLAAKIFAVALRVP